MLTQALAVLDKATKLLELRRARDHRIFEGLVQPLYADMLDAHNDYRRSFSALLALPKRSEIVKTLREYRDTLKPLRDKVHALRSLVQSEIGHELPQKYNDFFFAVNDYFNIYLIVHGERDAGTSPYTDMIGFLLFRQVVSQTIRHRIEAIPINLDINWQQLAQAYAKLVVSESR